MSYGILKILNINKHHYLFFISGILWFVIFFLNIPVFAQPVFAQAENVNAGFVANGIWFSLDPFFVNDHVRIYTAIQNQAGFDIIGKIQFFINDRLLGESNFSIINGRLIEKWVDWQAVKGSHKFAVKLIETKKTEPGKEPVSITLKFASITKADEQFVDFDTDKDRIGNREDTDDDNDGLSDEEEKKMGTDPLNPNDPPSPGKSLHPGSGGKNDILSKEKKEVMPVIEKAQKIINEITKKLEEKKQEIEKEIREEKAPKPILEKIPLLKIPKEKIPTWRHIYNWLITAVIYILNTWWLSLIVILIIFWILWKIIKIFR